VGDCRDCSALLQSFDRTCEDLTDNLRWLAEADQAASAAVPQELVAAGSRRGHRAEVVLRAGNGRATAACLAMNRPLVVAIRQEEAARARHPPA
jgi:hypothetical protein